MSEPCILCRESSCSLYCQESFSDRYFHCSHCDFRFLNPKYRLNSQEEKARYLEHNNDVNSLEYQKFMQPVVDQILKRMPERSEGLDFGAGGVYMR
jgi:hypothetical protein